MLLARVHHAEATKVGHRVHKSLADSLIVSDEQIMHAKERMFPRQYDRYSSTPPYLQPT